LFQVVAARHESGSIVLTTNRHFREWGALFDVDNSLATALIDRLMHLGEVMVIQGPSPVCIPVGRFKHNRSATVEPRRMH
jgi:DNA replication protein DnaC